MKEHDILYIRNQTFGLHFLWVFCFENWKAIIYIEIVHTRAVPSNCSGSVTIGDDHLCKLCDNACRGLTNDSSPNSRASALQPKLNFARLRHVLLAPQAVSARQRRKSFQSGNRRKQPGGIIKCVRREGCYWHSGFQKRAYHARPQACRPINKMLQCASELPWCSVGQVWSRKAALLRQQLKA